LPQNRAHATPGFGIRAGSRFLEQFRNPVRAARSGRAIPSGSARSEPWRRQRPALFPGGRTQSIAAFGARTYEEPIVYSKNALIEAALVSDPDAIKHVLLDNAANYRKGQQSKRLTEPMLGNGLVLAEGASWRFQRRTAAPMFQMRYIAGTAAAMAAAVDDMLARWSVLGEGAVVDVAQEMTRVTYDIISRTMFSSDVDLPFEQMEIAFANYLETLGRADIPALFLPTWFPTPNRLKGQPTLKFLKREIGAIIARRRAQIAAEPQSAPNDLLTLLLTAKDPEGGVVFGDAEVFDNVMTFIFAGHETTANAMAWTFYLLSQYPDWDARVADDSSAPGDTTRMVIEEAMRLYPPAPFISRQAIAPDVVGGFPIGAGTSVTVCSWVVHRHKTLWDDPDYFNPLRFAPGAREKIHRFAYLPFGAGPRICIGMGFAMQEATIILSRVARRFRLTLLPGHPVEAQARVTVRPKYGLKMRVERR
jgi:cytochrome P450